MNEFDIGGTEQYIGNPDIDGRFTVKDELINDYKCYEQGDNLIAWENTMFTNPGWVIHDKGNFYNGQQFESSKCIFLTLIFRRKSEILL